MKTSPVTFEDLSASVIAVPPLARNADLGVNVAENAKLIRHLEAGGVKTLMYGGNANFYNIRVSEVARTIEAIAGAASADTWIIPSAGADFGKMMDEAPIYRSLEVPTVMVLPQSGLTTPSGVADGIRRFSDAFGKQVIVYIKAEGYLEPEDVAALVAEARVCAIKYAIVRNDPAQDAYLGRLVNLIDRRYIISGIGELPAVAHFRDFGLSSFTSGSVCVAPALSMAMLRALRAGDWSRALAIREQFLPLETLRNRINPIRVLHDAVSLAGIADMGPILPLLSNLDPADRPAVQAAAKALLGLNAAREAA
ncbi:MAG TPA: dihydrodipicolinate synthase family protein [Alphaproteobacteria bacterium]